MDVTISSIKTSQRRMFQSILISFPLKMSLQSRDMLATGLYY